MIHNRPPVFVEENRGAYFLEKSSIAKSTSLSQRAMSSTVKDYVVELHSQTMPKAAVILSGA